MKIYVNPKGSVLPLRYGHFHISGKCGGATFSHIGHESLPLSQTGLRSTVWLMLKTHSLARVVITAAGPGMRPNADMIRRDASFCGKPSGGFSLAPLSLFDRRQKHRPEEDCGWLRRMPSRAGCSVSSLRTRR